MAAAQNAGPAVSKPAPSMLVVPEEWNFGEIERGEKVSFIFKVKNVGNAPLNFFKVNPTCGCTVVKASTGTLVPGEEREVMVTFDSTNFSKDVRKMMYVESNDPQSPMKQVSFYGSIRPYFAEFDATMYVDNIENITSEKGATRKLILKSRNINEIKIRKISTSSPDYKVTRVSRNSFNSSNNAYADIKIEPRIKDKKEPDYIYIELAVPIMNNYGQLPPVYKKEKK